MLLRANDDLFAEQFAVHWFENFTSSRRQNRVEAGLAGRLFQGLLLGPDEEPHLNSFANLYQERPTRPFPRRNSFRGYFQTENGMYFRLVPALLSRKKKHDSGTIYMLAFQGMSQAVSTTPTSPPSRRKSNSTRSPLTQPALHSQHPVFRLSAAEQGATEALSTAYTLEYVVVRDPDMQFRWYANPKSKDTMAQHTALMVNHLDFLM